MRPPGPAVINVGGIVVPVQIGKGGEILSRKTKYRSTPYRPARYVIWPKDLKTKQHGECNK